MKQEFSNEGNIQKRRHLVEKCFPNISKRAQGVPCWACARSQSAWRNTDNDAEPPFTTPPQGAQCMTPTPPQALNVPLSKTVSCFIQ